MEKIKVDKEVYNRLKEIAELKEWRVKEKLEDFLKTLSPYSSRTGTQNNALHKDFEIISGKLNDAGLDMRNFFKEEFEMEWTPYMVKEYIWKPIQKKKYGTKSTRDLQKLGQIDEMHDLIMRELGKKGIEYHDFPHDKEKEEIENVHARAKELENYPTDEVDHDKQVF